LSKPERQKNPSSIDKNVYHNIPINQSIDFSFEENNLDKPKKAKNKRGEPLN